MNICPKNAFMKFVHNIKTVVVIIQLKYTIEGVSKIPVPQEQAYFPRRSRGK